MLFAETKKKKQQYFMEVPMYTDIKVALTKFENGSERVFLQKRDDLITSVMLLGSPNLR
jgi:hypothetical protein